MQSPCPMHTLCQCSQYLQSPGLTPKKRPFRGRAGEAAGAQGPSTWPQPEAAQDSLPSLSTSENIRSKGVLQLILH